MTAAAINNWVTDSGIKRVWRWSRAKAIMARAVNRATIRFELNFWDMVSFLK
jgi:hypothetical protein